MQSKAKHLQESKKIMIFFSYMDFNDIVVYNDLSSEEFINLPESTVTNNSSAIRNTMLILQLLIKASLISKSFRFSSHSFQ